MQCFICQVCLASDVFLLFGSSVHGMLDGSSLDTSRPLGACLNVFYIDHSVETVGFN